MDYLCLELPVPADLHKILLFRYGPNYTASETEWLGITILHALNKKSARNYNYKRRTSYNCIFQVRISLDKANRTGFKLDAQKAHQIAKAMQRHFREELFMQTLINKDLYLIDYQTTLMDFLDVHDIDDSELSYRTLRKAFDRYFYQLRDSGELERKFIV